MQTATAQATSGQPTFVRPEEAGATDEGEFQALYGATARPILRYLMGVTGRRDVAEDILQETYCRYLGRELTGDGKIAALDTKEDGGTCSGLRRTC